MKIKNEQEQFEEWLVDSGLNKFVDMSRQKDCLNSVQYMAWDIQLASRAWRASREYKEKYRPKTLTWSVYFPEDTDKGCILSLVDNGNVFYCNVHTRGLLLIWEGEVEAFTEDEVMGYIQPYLDKIGLLPLEIEIYEAECDK